jgi:hypothetical protein
MRAHLQQALSAPAPARAVLGATAAALATGVLAAGADAGLVPNPANHRTLVHKPIEDFRYDPADNCRKQVPPGTKALERWLEHNIRGETWGISRCERLKRDNYSVHSEGRAIDWHLDAGVANEKRSAYRLIRTLIAKDRNGNLGALARRMGVQGLIFDCKAWWSGMKGLDKYGYCFKRNGERRDDLDRTQAHRDHIHIELNWPGARKRTSFWHSPVSR